MQISYEQFFRGFMTAAICITLGYCAGYGHAKNFGVAPSQASAASVETDKAERPIRKNQYHKQAPQNANVVHVKPNLLTEVFGDDTNLIATTIDSRLAYWHKRGVDVSDIKYVDDSEYDLTAAAKLMEISKESKILSIFPNGIDVCFERQHDETSRLKARRARMLIDHEIGHLVIARCSKDLKNLLREVFENPRYNQRLGTYAGGDWEEFFCESFSYYNAGKVSMLNPEMVKILKEIDPQIN